MVHYIFSPSIAPVREGRDFFFFFFSFCRAMEENHRTTSQEGGTRSGTWFPETWAVPCSLPIPSLRLQYARLDRCGTSPGLFPTANSPSEIWVQAFLYEAKAQGFVQQGGVIVQELDKSTDHTFMYCWWVRFFKMLRALWVLNRWYLYRIIKKIFEYSASALYHF